MGRIKRGCRILIGMLSAVSLFAAAGCEALHEYTEEMRYERAKEPSFFLKADSVYIISGSNYMELTDAGVMEYEGDPYLEGMLSEDNRYLYYLTYYNEIEYSGTLHMVETQSLTAPETIADDVYNARLSADGGTLLYATDVEENVGKLYRRNIGGESSLVAESVHCDCYGASYSGDQIYYLVKEEHGYNDTYVLYVQSGQQDAVALTEASARSALNIILYITIDYCGTMLYSLDTTETGSMGDIYIKKAGEEAKVVDKGRVEETVNGAEEFFYIKDGDRYYKAPGCDPVNTGSSNDSVFIQPYYGINPNHVVESRFLLDVIKKGAHALTELLQDGTKNIIAEGKFDGYRINIGFTCVAYEQDGALYTVHKKYGRWGKPEKRCDAPKYYYFNDAGDSLYYIALDDPDDDCGDAYRLSLRGGRADLLQRDVYSLRLCEDIPNTLTEDYGAYRIEDRSVRLGDPKIGPCGWLDETEGGYIVMFYRLNGDDYEKDIYFTEDGTDHTLVLKDVGDFVDVWGISELF
jgi:hypothetical protein